MSTNDSPEVTPSFPESKFYQWAVRLDLGCAIGPKERYIENPTMQGAMEEVRKDMSTSAHPSGEKSHPRRPSFPAKVKVMCAAISARNLSRPCGSEAIEQNHTSNAKKEMTKDPAATARRRKENGTCVQNQPLTTK